MKKVKRLFAAVSIMLCMSMILGMGSVFASDTNEITVRQVETSIKKHTGNYSDNLNGNLRSTSIPTAFWDLATQGDYEADLKEVRRSWLYTNYYFKPYSDGKIHVDFTIFSDTGRPTRMKVGIYDMKLKRITNSFISGESSAAGISESWEFSGCDVNTNYAIAFTAVNDGASLDSVSGTATIIQN